MLLHMYLRLDYMTLSPERVQNLQEQVENERR